MFKYLSSGLLLSVILLFGVGLVQVYSSSYIFAIESYGDGLYFFNRQLIFSLSAIVCMFAIIHTPWAWIEKLGWYVWPIAVCLLIATFIPGVGVRVGGAIRWIQTPIGFRIEPAEILKLSFSIMLASLIAKEKSSISKYPLWAIAIILIAPFFLLLRQPDFGSFAIMILVGVGFLFCFGLAWKYILGAVCVIVPAFYFLVMAVPYRRARIMAFLDPWSDPEQKGFQVIQSLLSFHSGSLTGVGLGQGQGKLYFLPEAHTDFTLAVLGEELGFFGVFLLFSMYGFLIYSGFRIAIKAEDTFQKALALGLSLTFSLSVFINGGVALGLLPTKGLTLPFLSYGGSSLLCMGILFGLLINIEKNLQDDRLSHRLSKMRSRGHSI
jgi:cell division protein FtsW